MNTIKKTNTGLSKIIQKNITSNLSNSNTPTKIQKNTSSNNDNLIDEVIDIGSDVIEEIIDPISKEEATELLNNFIEKGVNSENIKGIERHNTDMKITMKDGTIFNFEKKGTDWILKSIGYEGSSFEYDNGENGFLEINKDLNSSIPIENANNQYKINFAHISDGELIISAENSEEQNYIWINTNNGSIKIEQKRYAQDGKSCKSNQTWSIDSTGVLKITDHIEKTASEQFNGTNSIDVGGITVQVPYFIDNPNYEPENPFIVQLEGYKVVKHLDTGKKDHYLKAEMASDDHKRIEDGYVCVATYDPNTDMTTYHYHQIMSNPESQNSEARNYQNRSIDQIYKGHPDYDKIQNMIPSDGIISIGNYETYTSEKVIPKLSVKQIQECKDKQEYLNLVMPIYTYYCQKYGIKYPGVLALQAAYECHAPDGLTDKCALEDNNLGGLKYADTIPNATPGSYPTDDTGGQYSHFNNVTDYIEAQCWNIGHEGGYYQDALAKDNVYEFTHTMVKIWVGPWGNYDSDIIKDYSEYGLEKYELE